MDIVKVDNVKLPMVYSKRGKGHTDVIVSIMLEAIDRRPNVSGSVIDALDISDKLYQYGGSICSTECANDILNRMKHICTVRKYQFQFYLMMERVTTRHTKSFFPMSCIYIYDLELGKYPFIGVEIPIRISELPGTQSKLRLILNIATLNSFENMLDIVQKLTKFDMFPQAAFWNDGDIDKVSLQDIFNNIKGYFNKRSFKIKVNGIIELTGQDALNNRAVSIRTTF